MRKLEAEKCIIITKMTITKIIFMLIWMSTIYIHSQSNYNLNNKLVILHKRCVLDWVHYAVTQRSCCRTVYSIENSMQYAAWRWIHIYVLNREQHAVTRRRCTNGPRSQSRTVCIVVSSRSNRTQKCNGTGTIESSRTSLTGTRAVCMLFLCSESPV